MNHSVNNASFILTANNVSTEGSVFVNNKLNQEYLVLDVMVVVFAVVGVSGNIPVIAIYNKRKDIKASNTFIKVLAFIDLLVCVCIMPYAMVYEHHLVSSDIVCRSFEFIRHFAVISSNLTLVAIASERYIAVCRLASRVSVRTINKGIAAVAVISILMAVPAVGTFAVVSEDDVFDVPCAFPHKLVEGRFCHFTYSIMGKDFVTVYQIAIMVGFSVILVAIIILYIPIYVVLWRKAKIREQLTRRRGISLAISSKKTTAEAKSLCLKTMCHLSKKQSNNDTYNVEKMDNSPIECSYVSKRNSHNDPQNLNLKTSNDRHVNAFDHLSQIERRESETETLDQHVTFEGPVNRKPFKEVLDENILPQVSTTQSVPAKRNKLSLSFRSTDTSKRKRYNHKRTARMLFFCTVIYFVTWVPFWLDVFGLTKSIILRHMYLMSHATNPIVYGIVNRKVRKSLKLLLCGLIRVFGFKESTRATSATSLNLSVSGTSAG